jgi:hypothetical protein
VRGNGGRRHRELLLCRRSVISLRATLPSLFAPLGRSGPSVSHLLCSLRGRRGRSRSEAERSGARCGRRRRKAARLLALLRGDWRGRRRRERDRRGGPGVGMCGGSLIPGDAHAHATQGPEGDRARWARPDAARAIPHCSPVHANFYVPVPVAVGDPREKGGQCAKYSTQGRSH